MGQDTLALLQELRIHIYIDRLAYCYIIIMSLYFNKTPDICVLIESSLQTLVALGVPGAVHCVQTQKVYMKKSGHKILGACESVLKSLHQFPVGED